VFVELFTLLPEDLIGQPVGTEVNSGRNTGFLGENILWQDPQYIKSLANNQNNYHDIVDFVSASDETLLSQSSTGLPEDLIAPS
jgi:hypothetical protein